MLLAEVAPMSSTHRPSCEFNSRDTSPMPLERRASFCGTAGLATWLELRKNFITLPETDDIEGRTWGRDPLAIPHRNLSTKHSARKFSTNTAEKFARCDPRSSTTQRPVRPLSARQPSPSEKHPLQSRCAA